MTNLINRRAKSAGGCALAARGTMVATSSNNQQKKVVINVGGEKHTPYVSTLGNIPNSPLSWILHDECKAKLDYDPSTGEYFFDRHPGAFNQVLHYLQTGKLHCPRDICGPMFQKELDFWGIDESQMEGKLPDFSRSFCIDF